MESYRIIKKIETPAEHVGDTVAISFDCGRTTHPEHGEAELKGVFLCLEPFVDMETLHETRTEMPDIRGAALEWAEDMESLGVDFTTDANLKEISKKVTLEAFEPLTVFFPDTSRDQIKLILATHMAFFLTDDVMDCGKFKGKYRELVIEIMTRALGGELRHLGQLPSLPADLKACIGAIISCRNEALKSSVPEEWIYLQEAFVRYAQASFILDESPGSDVNEFLFQLTYRVGMSISVESVSMYCGLRLPMNLRQDSAFIRYVNAYSIYTGIINDITGFQRDINLGEPFNLILVLAKSMPLQEAVETSFKILEKKFYETKEAARDLLKKFPHDDAVKKFISLAGICTDSLIRCEFLAENRYGIKGTYFYSTVEFNSVYEEKEKELQAVLSKEPMTLLPEQDILQAEFVKLIEDMRLNNKGIKRDAKGTPYLPVESLLPLPAPPKVVIPRDVLIEPTTSLQHTVTGKKLNHVALIPDGNRRWARAQGLSPIKGHSSGVNAVKKLIKTVMEKGVHTLTIWILSPENFERSSEELENLWDIYRHNYADVRKIADEWDARIRHIGDRTRTPADILDKMAKCEEETKHRTACCIVLAIDYGGRQEIAQAVNRIKGEVTMETISQNLWTSNMLYPEPDLVIRTGAKDSGTVRTSGFLSWQSAYAEFLFEDKYLPEILPEDVDRWFDIFQGCDRRFGK